MAILFFLESIRSEWLNQLCIWLSMIGEETIFAIFGAILIWCVDKKWGFRMFFTSGVSQGIARLIKATVQMPRPFEKSPALTIVEASEKNAPGYSMPSGHCQGAANLLGTYGLRFSKKWFRILMALLMLAVMFARMELGVHTPLDCIVGTGISLVIVILYGYLFDKADGKLQYLAVITVISLALIAASAIFLYHVPQTAFFRPKVNIRCIKKAWVAFGTSLGASTGYLIDRCWVKYETKAPLWAQVIKVVVGIALMQTVDNWLAGILPAVFGDSLLLGGIRTFLLLVLLLGFYPFTFRIYKRFGNQSSDI